MFSEDALVRFSEGPCRFGLPAALPRDFKTSPNPDATCSSPGSFTNFVNRTDQQSFLHYLRPLRTESPQNRTPMDHGGHSDHGNMPGPMCSMNVRGHCLPMKEISSISPYGAAILQIAVAG